MAASSRQLSSFFILLVVFTTLLLIYCLVPYGASSSFRLPSLKQRIQARKISSVEDVKDTTARVLKVESRPQSRKLASKPNEKANRIRLLTFKYFRTFENFAYFSEFAQNRLKCKRGKRCMTATPVRHYHTCAIVGNGGILLDSSCGNEIDNHNYVIRINMAPIKGYEKDVGSKSNMTFVNLQKTLELRKDLMSRRKRKAVLRNLAPLNGSVISYVKPNTASVTRALEALSSVLKKNNLDVTITYSLRNVPVVMTRMLRSTLISEMKSPTSGLIAYILGTTFCDVITLYGFYPFATDMRNRRLFYHYYDHIPVNHRNRHNFNIEYDFLRSENQTASVRLVTDICT
ncbi:alpha-2,8-sialyltransferase 8B-like [Branchiostoma floridae x Branchiostoma japonicum]